MDDMYVCEECNKDIPETEPIGCLYADGDTWVYCSKCRSREMVYISLEMHEGELKWHAEGGGYVSHS